MSKIKGTFFFVLTALYTTFYILFIIIRGMLGFDLKGAIAHRQKLGRGMIKLNGVQREVTGTVPEGTYLFVSNHRTYFDPVLECPEAAFIPVVMNEVASWPIMGYGIKLTGVVYVKRENKSSRAATRDAIAKSIEDGISVVVYAEGGTNGLPTTKLFREGSFRIAAEKGISIMPMAVDYKDTSFYWTSKYSFVGHVIATFSKRMQTKVSFGTPITGTDSKALLEQTQSWIDGELIRFRAEWDAEDQAKA